MTAGLVEIQHAVGQLVEPFHDCLSAARTTLDTRRAAVVASERQRWLRTHILRGLTFRELENTDLGDWRLTGDHSKNGQVRLALNDGTMQIRMLRAAEGTRTPPAGHNHERRAYYINLPLVAGNVDLYGATNHRLLVLWEEWAADEDFDLRLIRPLEPGRYGTNLRADIDIDLPRSKPDFLGLRFQIADEDLTYGVADEEKGDGGAG